jgi:signal transduction histidine kinase/ligand-binding sensor domain-containing protein/DNA-binding response OmpR family regulator
MRRFFISSIFLLLIQIVNGQKPDYLFEHLTIDDGLSNNTVTSIVRDHFGFTWFATNDGLTRYDGYDFTVYQHDREDPSTLSNNKIHFVFEDSKRNLWIGTSSGLNLYDRRYDSFKRILHNPGNENSLSHNNIRTMYEDRSGALWFGTLGGGLNRFDPESERFTRFNFPDRNVTSVLEDSNGNFWVATGSAGIILFDWRNNEFTQFPFDGQSSQGLKPYTGKTLFEDNHGNLWVCTEGAGLYLFDISEKQYIEHFYVHRDGKGISSNIVSDILQYNDVTLWIATDGGGINQYNLETGSFSYIRNNVVDAKSLSTNAIYTIMRDKDEVIWIGTFGGGVNVLFPHRQEFRLFTHRALEPTSLSHKSVLSFHEDRFGQIWIGTDGGGLNLFDRTQGTFKSFSNKQDDPFSISSNAVTSILEDSHGHLWVGTFAGGLNRLERRTGRFTRFMYQSDIEGSIGSNNVWSLLEDRDQDLWVGTLDGLEIYNRKENSFYRIPDIERNGTRFPIRILSLFQDSKGNIWVGSTGVGILDKATLEFTFLESLTQEQVKLSDYDIRDFYEDKQGNIWIASEGAGLFRFDPKDGSLVSFTTRDGLPSDAIHQIIQDETGVLWLSTNKGISRFDPESITFSNYTIHDGLQSNQFAYSASLYSSRGEIYFGGVNGFNVFHPERIRENLVPPKVYITDFTLFNKPVRPGGEGSPLKTNIMQTNEITLPYRTVFSFKFTAINYISTSKNRYKYKLEGFDDWNDVGNQRMATYTNIGPGKYVFRVIASNNDGVWNEEGASVVINILPPFWRTWVAYLMYALAFVTLFYFILNYVVNRQKYKHDLMIKDLEKAKIEEINQVKLRFFTNIAHEFRTPLTLILGPLEKIMTSHNNIDAGLKKQLNIMGRNAGRLLRLINELMEFRKIEMGKVKLKVVKADLVSFLFDVKSVFDEHARMHDIDFSFQSERDVIEAWFDKEKMEKVVYNILSNSFKFTRDCGAISIEVGVTEKRLAGQENQAPVEHAQIIISDNGIGISANDLPRIFDRFYQVKNKNTPARSTGISGTGIGLALSRELIEFHKGEIQVASQPGEGSTFRVLFPLDKQYFDQEIVVEQTTDEFVYQYSPGLYGIPHAELRPFAEPPKVESNEDKPVLLFVDDNADMRSYIRSSLESSYHIYEAVNGVEGLEKAGRLMPDIIVSDVMMPEMDGIEMCRKIKDNINTSHLPVILLTAKTSDDFTIEGFDAGADDYIPKPFNPKLLHSRIKNILEIRQQLRERFRKEGILQPSEVSVTSADETFLKNAMEVVERNIGNPEFRVCTFVSEMNMSRSVLYRKFESLTGQSVNEFVRNTRLKRAAQLLSLNELTVSEVTYEVGFSDPQYFSKCFNKFYGITPSEYAKRNSKKTTG